MVDKPIDPTHGSKPSHTPPASHGAEKSKKPFSYEHGQWQAKPMTWLGMHFNADEAKKLWNVIIQNISSAIQKDQAKAVKALKKLRQKESKEE